jgi:spore coat protein U-like protein
MPATAHRGARPIPARGLCFPEWLSPATAGVAIIPGDDIMPLSRLGALTAAGAIAFGALVSATAPIANAEKISEKTIKSECSSAGGTYTSIVKGGTRFSTCDYRDNEGNGFRDYYADGSYYSTRPM